MGRSWREPAGLGDRRTDAIVARQDTTLGPECEGDRAVLTIPQVGVGLYLDMEVRHGRVPRVSDQAQRIAFPNPVTLANSQRALTEMREEDEETALELDDDEVPRRVRVGGDPVRAFGIHYVAARGDHRTVNSLW